MATAAVTDDLDRLGTDPHDPAEIFIAQAEAQRRRRQLLLLIAVLLMMGVGYVLSPGILVLLINNGMMPPSVQPMMEMALLPLEWAYERSELVQSFYEGYFELIGVDE